MGEKVSNGGRHRNLNPCEISRCEKDVQLCIEAVKNFMNPFSIEDKSHLYNISSGTQVPGKFERDILNAEIFGKEKKEVFINDRLLQNDKFFEPIKQLKLKTMADLKKTAKLKSSQNKVIMLKEQGSIAFQLLVKAQSLNIKIDL